jgi:hypothetical protein
MMRLLLLFAMVLMPCIATGRLDPPKSVELTAAQAKDLGFTLECGADTASFEYPHTIDGKTAVGLLVDSAEPGAVWHVFDPTTRDKALVIISGAQPKTLSVHYRCNLKSDKKCDRYSDTTGYNLDNLVKSQCQPGT